VELTEGERHDLRRTMAAINLMFIGTFALAGWVFVGVGITFWRGPEAAARVLLSWPMLTVAAILLGIVLLAAEWAYRSAMRHVRGKR
jgi:hypothetical protein